MKEQERINQVIRHGFLKGVFKVSGREIHNQFNGNQMDYIANQIIIELANAGFKITKTKK
jgi:hypothetical protein